jgi:hypothetical protein
MGAIFPQTLDKARIRENARPVSDRNPGEGIIYGVPDRPSTLDQLTELLDRFQMERAGGKKLEEVADAQAQVLTARIAALTDLLRGAEPSEAMALASRILLRDLTAVAAHFRGRANGMRASLAKALAELRDVHHASADSERR